MMLLNIISKLAKNESQEVEMEAGERGRSSNLVLFMMSASIETLYAYVKGNKRRHAD